jgi:twinkle protein
VAEIIRDDIDWSTYERATEAAVKVRKASDFVTKLCAKHERKAAGRRSPEMFSTKLRNRLEFRPGETSAWAGYSGHKKSTFTAQVALDLCMQRQRVLMASFEMNPEDTLDIMARQAYGANNLSPRQIEDFGRWSDGRLWIFDHLGRIRPGQCLAVCNFFASEKKGNHVFIDSMMMVCESEERLDEQKQFATDIVRTGLETGLHMHLIAHCRKPAGGDESKPPTKYDLRGSAAITDQAHNVLTVWANKARKAAMDAGPLHKDYLSMMDDPDAMVTCEKQRHGPWEGRIKLWFHEQSGRFTDERTTPVEPYRMGCEE